MKIRISVTILVLILTGWCPSIPVAAGPAPPSNEASGEIIDGYRVVTVSDTAKPLVLTVFRGDYLKFDFDPSLGQPTITIPALEIDQALLPDLNKTPYFKMKKTGRLPFSLGGIQGILRVIEYRRPNYQEVTPRQAKQLIDTDRPLILDVRTPREFKSGHLPQAILIPVQTLQKRWKEISSYQNRDVLIYCATGNRSTVASKILIDNGFKQIFNMRRGIAHWYRQKYEVVR